MAEATLPQRREPIPAQETLTRSFPEACYFPRPESDDMRNHGLKAGHRLRAVVAWDVGEPEGVGAAAFRCEARVPAPGRAGTALPRRRGTCRSRLILILTRQGFSANLILAKAIL